jgi:hypothetical protein
MSRHPSHSLHTVSSQSEKKEPLAPYSDEELEIPDDMKEKVERMMKILDEYGIDYDKFDSSKIPRLDFSKRQAYPNNDSYMHIPGQHNTQKWLQAIADIYRKEKSGENRVSAIRHITSGWNIMETFDFLNWIKFHEAGDHMKYKFAQLWYENDALGPGYFLQVKKDPTPTQEPNVSGKDIDFAKQDANDNAEKRERIEKQRNKIIGRLDSAEKLLRSTDGHLFAGKEFEALLESIYQLKKKIQMINKISSSTRLYEDMIIREANVLTKQGFTKAASVLHSVAQTPAASGEQAQGKEGGKDALESSPPADPSGAGNPGAPGGLPSVGPGMPQGAPSSAAPSGVANEMSPAPKGISDFISGLEKANFSPTDKQAVHDGLEVEDDSFEVNDVEDELLVTEAQVVSPAPSPPQESITTTPAPAKLDPSPVAAPTPKTNKPLNERSTKNPVDGDPLEVTEDDIKSNEKPISADTAAFDSQIDNAFKNVTISDVVAKLEKISKYYKTREHPRELSIVDMMLDSLGLASLFPSLSEALNKSLEANNYISTRVDDILSKLRGAVATQEKNPKPENDKPEVAGIKNKLQEDQDKEIKRKQMRKEQEASELDNKEKETPEVEIEEDLAPPPATPATKAQPQRPPA